MIPDHFHNSNPAFKKKKEEKKEGTGLFSPTIENIIQNGVLKWLLYYNHTSKHHWGKLGGKEHRTLCTILQFPVSP